MHWLYVLWYGYAWPSLKGNGPEALVQTVVYGAIAYAIVPPFRKWVNGHFKRVQETHDSIHAKLDAHHAEHQKHSNGFDAKGRKPQKDSNRFEPIQTDLNPSPVVNSSLPDVPRPGAPARGGAPTPIGSSLKAAVAAHGYDPDKVAS